jgi:hypothetical protein
MKHLRQAVALYESFREKKPHHLLTRHKLDTPKIAVCMGKIERLDYTTDHAGKPVYYIHKFAQGSRPLFCVSPNGQQLLLLAGRFKFDRRGIVDKDAHGRSIIPAKHARNPSDTAARRYLRALREKFPQVYADLVDPARAPYRQRPPAPATKSKPRRSIRT